MDTVDRVIVIIGIVIAVFPLLYTLVKFKGRIKIPKMEPYLNVTKENYNLYIDDLNRAKANIMAVFGEVDYRLYEQTRDKGTPKERSGKLYEAFKKTLSGGVKVEVFCGPQIVVDNSYKDTVISNKNNNKRLLTHDKMCEMNGLLRLVLDGVKVNSGTTKLILYYSKRRENNHFRLIDGKDVYLESYHRPLKPTENCWVIRDSFFWSKRLKRDFEKLRKSCTKCTTVEEIRGNFKFITEEELRGKDKDFQ